MMDSKGKFCEKYSTAEGFPVIVGAFCHSESTLFLKKQFKKISSLRFGSYSDPYSADLRLTRMLRQVLDSGSKHDHEKDLIVAAAANLPDVQGNYGAVLGNPFAESVSADENKLPHEICIAADAFHVVTYPGKLGVVFNSDFSQALATQSLITEILTKKVTENSIKRIINLFGNKNKNWMIAVDVGCLPGVRKGRLYISGSGGYSCLTTNIEPINIQEVRSCS